MTDQELKDLVASLAEDRKETDQQIKETVLIMKKLEEKVDRVCGKVGGMDDNIGHHAEQFFQDIFKRKKEFGGIHYDYIDTNVDREGRGGQMEIDIMLSNGDAVALIEVKNRIHPDFVTMFAEERVKKFRTLYPGYGNYKLYLGIAGFSFDKTVLERAKEKGVGIVKQVGEGVEIDAECLKAY